MPNNSSPARKSRQSRKTTGVASGPGTPCQENARVIPIAERLYAKCSMRFSRATPRANRRHLMIDLLGP